MLIDLKQCSHYFMPLGDSYPGLDANTCVLCGKSRPDSSYSAIDKQRNSILKWLLSKLRRNMK